MTIGLLAAAALMTFADARLARAAAGLTMDQLFWWQVVTAFGSSGYMFAVSGGVVLASLVLQRHPAVAHGWPPTAQRAAYVFACVAASGLAAQTVKHVVGRLRPRFLAASGVFHLIGPSWQSGADSFPSGHTTSAFAATIALALLRPSLAAPLLVAATLIGISRIATGQHFPSDAIAGAALGSSVSLALALALAHRGLVFTTGSGEGAVRRMPDDTARDPRGRS